MKRVFVWVGPHVSTLHREALRDLLGSEALVEAVEHAEGHYLAQLQADRAAEEKDAQIRRDLEELAHALEVLTRIYNPGGAAKALFEGEAVALLPSDVVERLRECLTDANGETLLMAARRALHEYRPRRHRPKEISTAARRWLVHELARIAEAANIEIKRSPRDGEPSDFHRLVMLVFERLRIPWDADRDIRFLLEHRADS